MNPNYSKNRIKLFPFLETKPVIWQPDWPLPQYQSHRGYWSSIEAQNSFESLSLAKQYQFMMAEIDIQVTKDGVPVLFHDFDLKITFKKNILISEINYADLIKIAPVPKLEDVLASTDRPEFLNIEIKSKDFNSAFIEEALVRVIKKANMKNKIIFSSFNHWSLIRLNNLLPEVPRALLITLKKEAWNAKYLKNMWLSPFVNPSLIHFDYLMLDLPKILYFKSLGYKISAWTVNDESLASDFLSKGVDSIITDRLLPKPTK